MLLKLSVSQIQSLYSSFISLLFQIFTFTPFANCSAIKYISSMWLLLTRVQATIIWIIPVPSSWSPCFFPGTPYRPLLIQPERSFLNTSHIMALSCSQPVSSFSSHSLREIKSSQRLARPHRVCSMTSLTSSPATLPLILLTPVTQANLLLFEHVSTFLPWGLLICGFFCWTVLPSEPHGSLPCTHQPLLKCHLISGAWPDQP